MKQDERQAIEHAARALGYDPDRIASELADAAPFVRSVLTEVAQRLAEREDPAGAEITCKRTALADLTSLLEAGAEIPSQTWLCERWRVPKYSVSRWMIEFEQKGLISREAIGRCKLVKAS